jgi:hypothetical protein
VQRTHRNQPRIAETLARAEELIETTGGEVMLPFICQRQAEVAGLKGDDAGRRRMLQEAHRLFVSMAAHGYAERLVALLKDTES